MAQKNDANPPARVRAPRQQRSIEKVELMLEAAMRLLDKGGMASLTTNAVAQTAGVSIGTLYQYFPNKDAILDALADREMASMGAQALAVIEDPAEVPHAERVVRIVRAVTSSYGQRRKVHRLVVEHSLARSVGLVTPMVRQVVARLTSREQAPVTLSEADAYVLTHAFVGVMRATILRDEGDGPADAEIEEALARLITSFAEHGLSPPAPGTRDG